ncbi:hypothetical protein GS426_00135 [Rhodococcus hoagii]|nr:hypothetical protein [Prescottella equi]
MIRPEIRRVGESHVSAQNINRHLRLLDVIVRKPLIRHSRQRVHTRNPHRRRRMSQLLDRSREPRAQLAQLVLLVTRGRQRIRSIRRTLSPIRQIRRTARNRERRERHRIPRRIEKFAVLKCVPGHKPRPAAINQANRKAQDEQQVERRHS